MKEKFSNANKKEYIDTKTVDIFGYIENEPLCVKYESILCMLNADSPRNVMAVFLFVEWNNKYNYFTGKTLDSLFISEKLNIPVNEVAVIINDLFHNSVIRIEDYE